MQSVCAEPTGARLLDSGASPYTRSSGRGGCSTSICPAGRNYISSFEKSCNCIRRSRATHFQLVDPRNQRRRRIIGQFFLAGVRPLDFQLVKQNRRAHDGHEGNSGAITDQGIVSGGNQVAAKRARVEFIENGAANQLLVAVINPDSIEQARREARAEGIHEITVLKSLVAALSD